MYLNIRLNNRFVVFEKIIECIKKQLMCIEYMLFSNFIPVDKRECMGK